MNKRTRLIIIVLLIILLGFIIKLITFWHQTNMSDSSQNNTHQTEEVDKLNYVGNNKYKIVRDKNGFYGVFDNEDNQVIAPIWNSISFLDYDKFIVSEINNSQISVGIIDENENVIAPFIYKSIERVSDNLILGIDKETLKFILFNNYGVPYINTEWESCSVSNGEINLVKDGNKYTAQIEKDKFVIKSMLINTTVKQKQLPVLVIDCLPNVDYQTYIAMINLCSNYIDATVDYDTTLIRGLTTADYYNSLISNNIMSLVDGADITSITPVIEESEIGFLYYCKVDITKNADDGEDIGKSEELNLAMEKGEDGNLFLMSAETVKKEIDSTQSVESTIG